MPDQNISKSPEFLQERVRFLEESNQRFMLIMEMLASSSEFQGDISRAKDGEGIFRATVSQLRRLLSFRAMGFLDSQPDGSFELVVADPAGAHDYLQALVEARIMDGTFAWALNHNQAVLVPAAGGDTLVLQVVATQSRVRGMFVATLPGSSVTMDAASLNALSIVLYTCAYALESAVLRDMLRDHTQHLEERVRLRTRDLEEARLQAEAASHAKSDFLANMSHEIRTPMNGIMGMTELLMKEGLTPQKKKLYLRAIKDSADSLMMIINDILDFSKIEAGKFTLEQKPFGLRDVIERCLSGLLMGAEEKGLKISCRIDNIVPICLVGDQGRLRQVMTNLVGNAIKFCHQGQITVDVGLAEQDMDSVLLAIRVTDTGIGIADEACQRIFNQFEQADSSTTRKFGGTGLGLAICKKLVELMDGKIWVESRLGEGSCFYFTARFLVGNEELLTVDNDIALSTIQPQQVSLDILLADDVEINRALMQAILEPFNHRITCVEDGLKALDAYKAKRFDVILMDVQMPEMDGLQTTMAIRKYELAMGLTPAVILAMTAFAGNEDRQICLDAGMDDYLAKPIKSDQLLKMIHKFRRESKVSIASTIADAPAPPYEPDEENEVFAQSELLERLGGRTEMISRFAGLFCKGYLTQVEGLSAALAAENADGVRQHAHAIKGSAGNISALRIHKIAFMMEKAAKQDNLADIPEFLATLQQEYLKFTDAVIALGFTVEGQ